MRGLGSGHVICGPMRGLKKVAWGGDRHTDGLRDSITESAQWADSVKIRKPHALSDAYIRKKRGGKYFFLSIKAYNSQKVTDNNNNLYFRFCVNSNKN